MSSFLRSYEKPIHVFKIILIIIIKVMSTITLGVLHVGKAQPNEASSQYVSTPCIPVLLGDS